MSKTLSLTTVKMTSAVAKRRSNKQIIDLLQAHPWISQLKASLLDFINYDQLTLPPLIRWLKKLESSMSVEAVNLRNKPNRSTKIASLLKVLIGNFKLLTTNLDSDEVIKLFPTLSLIVSYHLNLVLKSTMRNKKIIEQLAMEVYSFIKLILHDDPEYILDAILLSAVGENCALPDSFEHMILKLVILDKFLFEKSSSILLKYLCVVTLMTESGCNDKTFQDVIRRYPTFPADFIKYVISATNIKLKTDESIDLQTIAKRMHSRQIMPLCRKRLFVISVDDIIEGDEDSDDTTSMNGEDDVKVSSTNPSLKYSSGSQIAENESDLESLSCTSVRDSDNEKQCSDVENDEQQDGLYYDSDNEKEVIHCDSDSDCENNIPDDSDVISDNEEYDPRDRSNKRDIIQINSPATSNTQNRVSFDDDDDDIECLLDDVGHLSRNQFEAIGLIGTTREERDEADPSSDEAEAYVPRYPTESEESDSEDDEDVITAVTIEEKENVVNSPSREVRSDEPINNKPENVVTDTISSRSQRQSRGASTTSSQTTNENDVPTPTSTKEEGKSKYKSSTPTSGRKPGESATPLTRRRAKASLSEMSSSSATPTVSETPKITLKRCALRSETAPETRKSARNLKATPTPKKAKVETKMTTRLRRSR